MITISTPHRHVSLRPKHKHIATYFRNVSASVAAAAAAEAAAAAAAAGGGGEEAAAEVSSAVSVSDSSSCDTDAAPAPVPMGLMALPAVGGLRPPGAAEANAVLAQITPEEYAAMFERRASDPTGGALAKQATEGMPEVAARVGPRVTAIKARADRLRTAAPVPAEAPQPRLGYYGGPALPPSLVLPAALAPGAGSASSVPDSPCLPYLSAMTDDGVDGVGDFDAAGGGGNPAWFGGGPAWSSLPTPPPLSHGMGQGLLGHGGGNGGGGQQQYHQQQHDFLPRTHAPPVPAPLPLVAPTPVAPPPPSAAAAAADPQHDWAAVLALGADEEDLAAFAEVVGTPALDDRLMGTIFSDDLSDCGALDPGVFG